MDRDKNPYSEAYFEGKQSNYSIFGGYGSFINSLGRRILMRKAISSIKKYKPRGKLMDIGCAYGYFVNYASKKGFDASGFDISEYAIRRGYDMFPLVKNKLRCSDITGLKIDKKFDVITAFEVLEHCRSLGKSVEKIKKMLKPNGILLITVPDAEIFPEHEDRDETHVWRMAMDEWQNEMERLGLKCLERFYYPLGKNKFSAAFLVFKKK